MRRPELHRHIHLNPFSLPALSQACSILYKTRLPLLLVFNKVDVARPDFALEWMQDFETFFEALRADTSYAASLSRSMSLVLEKFYMNLRAVGVSAITGEGIDEFMRAVDAAREEFDREYLPDLERRKQVCWNWWPGAVLCCPGNVSIVCVEVFCDRMWGWSLVVSDANLL